MTNYLSDYTLHAQTSHSVNLTLGKHKTRVSLSNKPGQELAAWFESSGSTPGYDGRYVPLMSLNERESQVHGFPSVRLTG